MFDWQQQQKDCLRKIYAETEKIINLARPKGELVLVHKIQGLQDEVKKIIADEFKPF